MFGRKSYRLASLILRTVYKSGHCRLTNQAPPRSEEGRVPTSIYRCRNGEEYCPASTRIIFLQLDLRAEFEKYWQHLLTHPSGISLLLPTPSPLRVDGICPSSGRGGALSSGTVQLQIVSAVLKLAGYANQELKYLKICVAEHCLWHILVNQRHPGPRPRTQIRLANLTGSWIKSRMTGCLMFLRGYARLKHAK